MPEWIALLRGVNVGGKNKLPSADFTSVLEELDCRDVQTVIQSGNAVFYSKSRSSKRLSKVIADAIEQRMGFRPDVMLVTESELQAAADANPFLADDVKPATLHYYFLQEMASDPDNDQLNALAAESERHLLSGKVFYLFAPDGVGRSRLAAQAEKCIGVAVTARNHRTIQRLLDVIKSR